MMAESGRDSSVEDVLTSVRRLVSNEVPRNTRPELPKSPDALVLTDSHRIASNEPARKAGKSLEDRIAELEAAVNSRSDEWEPDGSEDQAMHRPTRIVYTRPPNQDESDEVRRNSSRLSQLGLVESDDSSTEVEEEITDADEITAPEFHHDVEEVEPAPMAEDVPIAPRPKAEVAAFGNPDDVVANIEKRWDSGGELVAAQEPQPEETYVETAEDAAEDVSSVNAETEPPVAPLVLSQPQLPDSAEATNDSVVDEIDAAEAEEVDPSSDVIELPVEDEPDHWENEALEDQSADVQHMDPVEEAVLSVDEVTIDVASISDAPAQTGAIQLETQNDDVSPLAPETTATEVAEHGDAPDVDTEDQESSLERELAAEAIGQAVGDMLGGEHLRPVVAQMIRQELQGELGERITRNVRKLVRREIKRALQSQDLE